MSSSNIIDGINYGPLASLIGHWQGDKGKDIAPEPDGTEENLFYETILYEAIGDVTNAEMQVLAVLRYHQVVTRKSTNKVFHNETGYWSWDSKNGQITHSLTIPRGVCVLAGGEATIGDDGATKIQVEANIDSQDWGIIQSPFMQKNARTIGFKQNVSVHNQSMHYKETTILEIYGKRFDHTDENTLTKNKGTSD